MLLYLFILGICIGSFLNVVIDRLPEGKKLNGRSKCDHCRRTLTPFELIPIVSWILQRGKSRCCGRKLSVQYPLIELATGIGFVFTYMHFQSFLWLGIFSVLLAIAVIDLKTQLIPDILVYILGGLALFALPFPPPILPALGSWAFLYVIWFITRGRGMGYGDVKLVFVLGLLAGYPGVIILFYTAFLTGALVGVILILGKYSGLKSKIPFGPFLILGIVISILYQNRIMDWWKGLL